MKRGDMAEAQRLLDQLRNILENLKTARPNNRMSDPIAREMSRRWRSSTSGPRAAAAARRDLPGRAEPAQRQRQTARPPAAGPAGPEQQRGQRQQGQQASRASRAKARSRPRTARARDSRAGQGLGQRQQALRERLREAAAPHARHGHAGRAGPRRCRGRHARRREASSARARTATPSTPRAARSKACSAACRAWPSRCSR